LRVALDEIEALQLMVIPAKRDALRIEIKAGVFRRRLNSR